MSRKRRYASKTDACGWTAEFAAENVNISGRWGGERRWIWNLRLS